MLCCHLTSGPSAQAKPSLKTPRALMLVVAASALSGACGQNATTASAHVAAIAITPASLSLSPGAAHPVSASVLDASGARLSVPVVWSAEDAGVATVSTQGVVTGVAVGRTQVAASKGGVSAVIPVSVSALPPALVRVNPTASTISVGAATSLNAEVLDAQGGKMTGQTVKWSSSDVAIANVDAGGVVTGVSAGSVVITAEAAGLRGTAVVTVDAPHVASVTVAPANGTIKVGRTLQLEATIRDGAGKKVTGRAVTWSSSSIATAIVLPTGLVTGVSKGRATIRATVDGKTGSASITVR